MELKSENYYLYKYQDTVALTFVKDEKGILKANDLVKISGTEDLASDWEIQDVLNDNEIEILKSYKTLQDFTTEYPDVEIKATLDIDDILTNLTFNDSIGYILTIGYADIDEYDRYEDAGGWKFVVIGGINDKYQSLVFSFDKKFSKISAECEDPKDIAQYLVDIDAMGRSAELYSGTIRCAQQGDEDGLSDLINEEGISVDIFDEIPSEIDGDHDGRMFVISQSFLVNNKSIKKVIENNFNELSFIETNTAISV